MTTHKSSRLGWLLGISSLLLSNTFFLRADAEVIVPPIPANQLAVEVQPQVTRDPNTQVYTYKYTVTNYPSSLQEMSFFAVELAPGTQILNPMAPAGWDFGVHNDQPIASWAAVEIGERPPDYVDDGNVVPSAFNIKPGETISGFSFQTLAAPADGKFYAQGFTKLPQVSGGEGEISEDSVPPFTEGSYTSITTTPNLEPYGGGRRPAVDGFLVFLNVQREGNVFASPVTIIVKFSAAGETVNRQSFRATLNQQDVTNLFVTDTTYGGDLVAQFNFQNSSLSVGRNVLITSVDGTVPETTRTASDVDRVTFSVQN